MSASRSKSLPAIGFLTVLEDPQHGLFGGFLLLNSAARPLEFHCTAPVKPNRAQEILYGPTLQPYLYGEQIGQTLLAKTKINPAIVWTDVPAALAVRDFVSLPIVLVETANQEKEKENHAPLQPLHRFELGSHHLSLGIAYSDDQDLVTQIWQPYCDLDLAEPFDRIHEAIREAQHGSRAA